MGDINTSLEGNLGTKDVMQMSPTHAKKSGTCSDVRKDIPSGSTKKPKPLVNQRIELTDSSGDEFEERSDDERIALGRSRRQRCPTRAYSSASDGDQSPEVSNSNPYRR